MKKMTILAVILVLVMALTACGSKDAPEATATATPTTAATVPAETTAPSQPLTLTSWNLGVSTWSSPNGATVHLTAAPSSYAEGQAAAFVVRLEGDDVLTVPCQWDGTNYTADADLNAANGYCYYVTLTAADGTVTEIAVNTPAEPTDEALINMEAALTSYCSLIVEESEITDNKLTLTTGKAQVQVPVITDDGAAITCQSAVLTLNLGAEEIAKAEVTLEAAETTGLFEAAISGMSFDIPALENEQQLELVLNATLSNGQELTAYGSSWVAGEGSLLPVVG